MNQETVRPEAERAASREEENRDHGFYRKGFSDGQAKVGAEVLAACIKAVELAPIQHRESRQHPGEMVPDGIRTVQGILELLQELQPAASDLKALLREAKLEVHKSRPRPVPDESWESYGVRLIAWHKERIAELEEARAEGKG